MIPRDDFTPHGYLDNPAHAWKLNPGGVLRSQAPLGMGWLVPNLGSYVLNQFQYSAYLHVGLKINDLVLITPEDFRLHRCTISSPIHTKNRLAYTCQIAQYDLTLTVSYCLMQEHVLGCTIEISTLLDYPLPLTCYLIHQHTHNPHTSRLWEHGWYALQERAEGHATLGLASEGDAFTHGLQAVGTSTLTYGEMGFCSTLSEISAWAGGARIHSPNVTQREQESGWQMRVVALPYTLTVGARTDAPIVLNAALARGVSQDHAQRSWRGGLENCVHVAEELRQADEQFWRSAPQLSGDWPAHWRRGLVYDLETLRMVIRQPLGEVPGHFDGMQIQAPRLVLAEAALDVLFLSYADPELAAEVLLTHFASAPRPNLPCMREDGSYNMVADDGQICGTAPEWGYPLWCCHQLWLRSGNLDWLRQLYPGASAYLRWWLEQRRDRAGYLVYACSWESGQDVSSRFGPQQTGGTIIQHVQPVDLQASMAQGAAILAQWAQILADAASDEPQRSSSIAEHAYWTDIAEEFTVKTQLMWREGWFRDYDASANVWSSERDAMHLAPVFCGAAAPGHVEQVRPILAEPPRHSSQWAPLSWPPVVLTLIGATAAAQMHHEAAELAYRFIDASFRSTDRREPDEHGGLPGVTREYLRAITSGKWGEIGYANAGIEGYGWGALSIHLLIRHLFGLHATDPNTIVLAPTLPQTLRRPRATYTIAPIPWGKYALSLTCRVKSVDSYEATLQVRPRTPEDQPTETTEPQPATIGEQEHRWEGIWGEEQTFRL